ncbi:MAG: type III-B CRISPR module RAMP protein Cmr4, partial [Candidatus Caldarchaeales archaeon]
MSLAPVYYITKPYLIYALTPLHAGIGKGFGEHVDLPVQRDSWGIPCIWGSSIKGALRTTFRNIANKMDIEKLIFGPERERAHEHAGALNILDARLFLSPTTSLKYGFIYITTSLLLERTKMIFELSGKQDFVHILKNLIEISSRNGKAFVSNNEIALDNKVWIGDKVFECDTTKSEDVRKSFENILKDVNIPISLNMIIDRIVILPDRYGLQILSRSTSSITRIGIDYRKKTVRTGALWDEEYVSESSMFTTAILMSNPRIEETKETWNAETLFNDLMK